MNLFTGRKYKNEDAKNHERIKIYMNKCVHPAL